MSFGVIIGDFITVGTLAYQLVSACNAAPIEYHELGELCLEISTVIESCKPLDPKSVLKRQHVRTITLLSANCRATLQRLELLLGRYENLGTVQNLGKRIGFTGTKTERENIRNRLKEHILFMGTFFSGVQVETLGFTVKLLLKVLEERSEGPRKAALETVINNPDKLEDLLKVFGSENEIQLAELEKEKGLIKDKLEEAARDTDIADLKSAAEPSVLANAKLQKKENSTIDTAFLGPVRDRLKTYDPNLIDWFKNGGHRFLTPIMMTEEMVWNPPRPIIRYSERETNGYASFWRAVYYTFNGLSCSRDDKPRSSRAYFLQSPFLTDHNCTFMNSPPGFRAPRARFFNNYSNTLANSSVDPTNYQSAVTLQNWWAPCVGFTSTINGIPFDLGDDVSCELAEMLIGTNGVQTQYSQKVIEQHLPEDWTYYPNSSGKQHHIYEDDEGVESTVHPARYYDPDSEVPCRLPNGWDRRLDSWGNLFFVDHHTKQAVREDPRFNRKVDQETALPKGWQKVKDHRGHPFFYTLRGKVVVGTDIPSSMNSKSMEGKMRLSRAPVNGDDPTLLREKTRRQIEDENMQKAAASVVPMMTPLEKETYWKLFGQVQKASRFFATIEEILVFCEVFDLSRDIIVCAFTNTDTNRDDQWNIDEFANALYEIKFELEKKYRTNTTPPMTTDERRKYHSMYEQYKHPEQPVLRTREVSAACKEYGLPDDKLKSIWRQADLNHDWRWNIDEFADAMHETINEARRRKVLEKLAPTTLPTSPAFPFQAPAFLPTAPMEISSNESAPIRSIETVNKSPPPPASVVVSALSQPSSTAADDVLTGALSSLKVMDHQGAITTTETEVHNDQGITNSSDVTILSKPS